MGCEISDDPWAGRGNGRVGGPERGFLGIRVCVLGQKWILPFCVQLQPTGVPSRVSLPLPCLSESPYLSPREDPESVDSFHNIFFF